MGRRITGLTSGGEFFESQVWQMLTTRAKGVRRHACCWWKRFVLGGGGRLLVAARITSHVLTRHGCQDPKRHTRTGACKTLRAVRNVMNRISAVYSSRVRNVTHRHFTFCAPFCLLFERKGVRGTSKNFTRRWMNGVMRQYKTARMDTRPRRGSGDLFRYF